MSAARFDLALPLGAIRDGDRIDLAADDAERAALARELGFLALHAFKAQAMLERDRGRILARGRIEASLEQACVASGEPVAETVDEAFALTFVPDPGAAASADEVELAAEELDTIFHDGATIPLGRALVDTLSLAVEPYPRGPNAAAAMKEAGVLSEEEAGPFAALAALKQGRADEP